MHNGIWGESITFIPGYAKGHLDGQRSTIEKLL